MPPLAVAGALAALAGLMSIMRPILASQTPSTAVIPPPYTNIEILRGISAAEMRLIMEAMNQSLGVDCTHCHVPENWALEEKPAKENSRAMMRMVAEIGETHFETLEPPSCWTCHRGAVIPEVMAERPGPRPDLESAAAARAFSNENQPSRDVYRNIQVLGDLPANRLRDVMIDYSRALGVGCTHCHTPGDWPSDAVITKPLTRRMLELERAMEADFFGRRNVLSCWTCHRGQRTPETSLP